MDPETQALIHQLIQALGDSHSHRPNECGCRSCCSCTTDPTFEASAARWNEQAASVAAASLITAQQQQSAQFSQLLKLQAEITQNQPIQVNGVGG